ncbi:MAG TPA: magnesium and cobalt transport protein CorA [Solirubrobacteraceae bacterium]|nr:magnesium and cobalt transport protein CorA [Solirubrobacteraceae bacterium]
MIVDAAVYEDGRRLDGQVSIEEAGAASGRNGTFVWLGVAEPTEEEFDAIAREFALHELAVEDAVHAHQRPKLEVYGDSLLVVLKTARYVDSQEVVHIGEVLLFVHPTFLVSVRHGETGALKTARRRLESRDDLMVEGPGAPLYGILDAVVDDYEAAADGLEYDIQEVESEVFTPGRTNPAERIFKLEREVLEFQRAVTGLVPALDRLARGQFDVIPEMLHPYLRDVHDHLLRVTGRMETFRELLGSALHANLTQVSVRQNEDIRKISAWVAILAVPTMVAGLYGMNFEHMPELRWELGYPTVLAVIAAVCAYLFWRFKRAGWL